MENNFFRLRDFLTEKKFRSLKKYFLSYDYYNSYYNSYFNKYVKTSKNPKIIIEEEFFLDNEEEKVRIEVELEFLKDFIFPGIESIYLNDLNNFKKLIYKKGIFSKEQKEGFALESINKLEEQRNALKNLHFLSPEIKDSLSIQIDLIKKEIENYIQNPYPHAFKKVEFNWNKTDIIVFFHLLKKNKQLNNSTSADLGKIIDKSFKYKNEKGDFENIKNSRKDLNSYNNSHKGYKLSIDRLKAIFTDKNFYCH